MEDRYGVLGFTYKKTPIQLREKIAFNQEESEVFLKKLQEKYQEIKEILLLSTCNRTEFFFVALDFDRVSKIILKEISSFKCIPEEELNQTANFFVDTQAIHHILMVASSLDSIVVGETQIAGQLKDAYRFSYEKGFCARGMMRMIHFAFKTAAKVRNQTQISGNAVSIASIAALKAKEFQEKYQFQKRILIIGAGEMGCLAAKYFLNDGFEVHLINRNWDKLVSFKQECKKNSEDQIKIYAFEDIFKIINDFSLVLSATSSPKAVVLNSMIKPSKESRFFFDLALPRDIEVLSDKNIKVLVIDDLKQIAQSNLAQRQDHILKAYEIVGVATMEFLQWLQTLGVEPLIKRIRELAQEASAKELDRAIKKGFLPKEMQFNVEKILQQAFNNFLHKPTGILRAQSAQQESDIIVESVKAFFGLNDEAMLLNTYKCEYDQTKE